MLGAATEKAFTIIADLKAKSCAPCGKRIYQMVSNRLIEVEGCIWVCTRVLRHVLFLLQLLLSTQGKRSKATAWINLCRNMDLFPRRKSLGHLGQRHLDF